MVDQVLEGRVALVTGGATGIGASCVVAFAEAGADVALLYHGREPEAALLDRVRATGRRLEVVQADVAVESDVEGAMNAVTHGHAHPPRGPAPPAGVCGDAARA